MPVYEYLCVYCNLRNEFFQKYSFILPLTCKKCKKSGFMVKTVSLSSFTLKGGGWFKDLYASSKSNRQSKKTII